MIALNCGTRRSLLRWLPTAVLLTLSAASATAQSPARYKVRVYHGETVAILGVVNALEEPVTVPQPWMVAQGSEVCVQVVNAHPMFYTYASGVTIDSSTPADEKLPASVAELAGLFTRGDAGGASAAAAAVGSTASGTWLSDYVANVTRLEQELTDARALVARSETPEPMDEALRTPDGKGLRWLKQALRGYGTGDGHIGSASIREAAAGWARTAREAAAKEKDATAASSTILNAIDNYAKRTIDDFVALRDAVQSASPTWQSCTTIGQHPTTITLSITAKEAKPARQTGPGLKSLTVEPEYHWKTLELAPMGLAVWIPGAVHATLASDSTVAFDDDNDLRARAGAVMIMHLHAFGGRKDRSLGVLGGIGLVDGSSSTTGKPDFYLGAAVRFKDVFGVGAAFVIARRPVLRSGVKENQPLPAKYPTIGDATHDGWRSGLALLFTIRGLGI